MAGKIKKYISASELGDYMYCARSWRLGSDGYSREASREVLEKGTHHHEEHGRNVFKADGRVKLGRFLFIIGILAFIAAILLSKGGWETIVSIF
jgi:hypothetical protein